MHRKTKEISVQLLRLIFAIPLGIELVKYFKFNGAIIRILFFFGIYILVSVILEIIQRLFTTK